MIKKLIKSYNQFIKESQNSFDSYMKILNNDYSDFYNQFIEKETKIEYIKPNFEAEWEEAERYPEFKDINKWLQIASKGYTTKYSIIKNFLGNTNLDFNSLENNKKQRFKKAFKLGKIEMPIVIKFEETDYDLLGGNTRLSGLIKKGIDPIVWVVDLT